MGCGFTVTGDEAPSYEAYDISEAFDAGDIEAGWDDDEQYQKQPHIDAKLFSWVETVPGVESFPGDMIGEYSPVEMIQLASDIRENVSAEDADKGIAIAEWLEYWAHEGIPAKYS